MKTFATALILTLGLSITTRCQTTAPNTSFGLKGDVIGESLAEFRERNRATFAEDGQMPNDPKIDYVYPRCSGDITIPPIGDDWGAYLRNLYTRYGNSPEYNRFVTQSFLDKEAKDLSVERLCKLAPVSKTPPYLTTTIAGVTGSLEYTFKVDSDHVERLDEIYGKFDKTGYSQVRQAIVAKYGAPTSTKTKSYENKMGATFQGEMAYWEQPQSAIVLNEIREDNIDGSNLIIINPATPKAWADKAKAKATSDF
jgi:hypothetical protein